MGQQDNTVMAVRAIENGTVIDHIPASALFKIIRIMGLDRDTEHRMTFGANLESKRMGTKAIIKINDRYLATEEINKIALIAPNAIVNTIRNYNVTDKRCVTLPEEVRGFVKCANPACITNHQPVETAFSVLHDNDVVSLRCRYCEKHTNRFEIK
jgi:aspartate carbamoyltransferase regulatory subunit